MKYVFSVAGGFASAAVTQNAGLRDGPHAARGPPRARASDQSIAECARRRGRMRGRRAERPDAANDPPVKANGGILLARGVAGGAYGNGARPTRRPPGATRGRGWEGARAGRRRAGTGRGRRRRRGETRRRDQGEGCSLRRATRVPTRAEPRRTGPFVNAGESARRRSSCAADERTDDSSRIVAERRSAPRARALLDAYSFARRGAHGRRRLLSPPAMGVVLPR